MKRFLPTVLLLAPLLAASGCGIFKTEEQQRAARTREKPLEVPPDLTTPGAEERLVVKEWGSMWRYWLFAV